jgi:hypothetical protein
MPIIVTPVRQRPKLKILYKQLAAGGWRLSGCTIFADMTEGIESKTVKIVKRKRFDPNKNKGDKNVTGISWIVICAKHFLQDVPRSAQMNLSEGLKIKSCGLLAVE